VINIDVDCVSVEGWDRLYFHFFSPIEIARLRSGKWQKLQIRTDEPGVTEVPRGIVGALLPRRRALARASLVAVVTELWARPLFECRLAASMLLGDHAEALAPADAALVERLIREAGTWALVDELAPAVMGGLVERYPELTAVLDRWAADEDFWVRRAALLSLLRPLRRGEGDFDRFARYADMMLAEREFFIRKAIGWVLRDTGRRRPDLVAAWLEPRIGQVSGVTLREAVKPLPPETAARLLAAYRARSPAVRAR